MLKPKLIKITRMKIDGWKLKPQQLNCEEEEDIFILYFVLKAEVGEKCVHVGQTLFLSTHRANSQSL